MPEPLSIYGLDAAQKAVSIGAFIGSVLWIIKGNALFLCEFTSLYHCFKFRINAIPIIYQPFMRICQ